MSLAKQLLPEFDREMASTRKFLELVPEDKFTWKPHEKSMTLGNLAGHLAELPDWTLQTVTKDSLALTDEEGKPLFEPFRPTTRQQILEKFDGDLVKARAELEKVSDEAMAAQWTMTWQGQAIVDSPRAEVIRTWALSHMIHHRAQLGVYLRMNDISIPGVYGPSADEMPS